ncbi:PREDICTED: LOW QUALITY PROTEIN: WAP four-disulfide core domain protein 12 [Galeopterus variegatus]|uniref:LOW QUALITY PROTEIN: WAP four-disulfide core domain protein 12 n=1 Tax=Galeopterus variegatus TaxID=482537 RepID=A0ABM0Q049_GALVR|nr:PREDICTED: LOW QUALITY PROTEIN: WAP four-disulfide core domain protein 12 [Galeopterus variegatus]
MVDLGGAGLGRGPEGCAGLWAELEYSRTPWPPPPGEEKVEICLADCIGHIKSNLPQCHTDKDCLGQKKCFYLNCGFRYVIPVNKLNGASICPMKAQGNQSFTEE